MAHVGPILGLCLKLPSDRLPSDVRQIHLSTQRGFLDPPSIHCPNPLLFIPCPLPRAHLLRPFPCVSGRTPTNLLKASPTTPLHSSPWWSPSRVSFPVFPRQLQLTYSPPCITAGWESPPQEGSTAQGLTAGSVGRHGFRSLLCPPGCMRFQASRSLTSLILDFSHL